MTRCHRPIGRAERDAMRDLRAAGVPRTEVAALTGRHYATPALKRLAIPRTRSSVAAATEPAVRGLPYAAGQLAGRGAALSGPPRRFPAAPFVRHDRASTSVDAPDVLAATRGLRHRVKAGDVTRGRAR